jgi:hypothetical protein
VNPAGIRSSFRCDLPARSNVLSRYLHPSQAKPPKLRAVERWLAAYAAAALGAVLLGHSRITHVKHASSAV